MSYYILVQRIGLVTAALLGLATLATPGASAALSAHTTPGIVQRPSEVLGHWKVKYSKEFTYKSINLPVCVKLTATGDITYTTTYTARGRAASVTWTDQKVNDPTLKVVTFNHRCTKHRSVQRIVISQHWTGYECSFNPSISVDVSVTGLSVSVSAWPSCGERNQAIYTTSYGRGWHHTQYNGGSPIGFGDYTDPVTGVGLLFPPPCYGVYPSTVFYYGGNSDSYGAGNIHASGKVCLNKYE
jgi:hypothetical protein